MEDFNKNSNNVYQRSVPAGKRKYFLDIKTTRSGDHYITISERKKKERDGYYSGEHERHTIFLYKEDLNKFAKAFSEVNDKMREILPDYDFSQYEKTEERDS